MITHLLAFLGVSAVVIVTPGQDTALTIRNTLLGGRRSGILTAAGVSTGQAIWALATSAGIAAVLRASAPAFETVKLAGAAYLIWLGLQTIFRGSGEHQAAPSRAGASFRQGVVSNLGNPKMAIFFSSLLPQFVPSGPAALGSMLGLGLLFVSMTLGWLCLYAAVVARFGDLLARPRVRRMFDAVMGAILVAFGVRLATERS